MIVDSTGTQGAAVIGAIRNAARQTGADFQYLLATAQVESGLNPTASVSSSSAKGLFQFIDQTWFATMKATGAALGYGQYADGIVQNSSGHYQVSDPALRSTILQLRSDPTTSALMAGAFARDNATRLAQSIGRTPSDGEIYIAHFLGPDGAGRLISAANSQPGASAAAMFPQAAAANSSIFYARGGAPRTVGEVYAKLTGRFDAARNFALGPTLRGSDSIPAPTDTAAVTQVFAAANKEPQPPPPAPASRPAFQSMFSDRVRAVTQTVTALWTQPGTDTGGTRPLSLFTDRGGDARKPVGS